LFRTSSQREGVKMGQWFIGKAPLDREVNK
jgi:hypothetical protein